MPTTDLKPVFRVSTYSVDPGAFTGTTYDLTLDHDLSANYFVQIFPGEVGDVDNGAFRVSGDPFGTGDLVTTSGSKVLRLARENNDVVGPSGTVVVIESLRDHDTNGFRLVDVASTAATAASAGSGLQSTTDTITVSVGTRLVLYGGIGGGGASLTDTANWWGSIPARMLWESDGSYRVERYAPTGQAIDAVTYTTYAVRWGSAWTVQEVHLTGSNAGTPPYTAGEWNTVSLDTAVTAENTMLHWQGYTEGALESNWGGSVVVRRGDGVTAPSGSISEVAATLGTSASLSFQVWALTHASLVVSEYDDDTVSSALEEVEATIDSAVNRYEWHVTAPNICVGRRACRASAVCVESAGSDYLASLWWAIPTQIDLLLIERNNTGSALSKLNAQIVDFGSISIAPEAAPTIRITQAQGQISDGNTSVNIDLPHDLAANYFIQLQLLPSSATALAPDRVGARLTADPFGSGPLTASGADNRLTFTRETGSGDLFFILTVWECVADPDGHGFRLRGVEEISVAAESANTDQVHAHTCTNTSAWSEIDHVVVYAGLRGGGVTTAAGLAAQAVTLAHHAYPVSTNQIRLTRRASASSTLEAATFTAFVVEWGSGWDVQQVVINATLDNSYSILAPLSWTVNPEKTMVHAWAVANGSTPSNSAMGYALHLGDGTTTPSEANTIALASVNGGTFSVLAVVLSHPELDVQWVAISGSTASGGSFTVAAPVDRETEANLFASDSSGLVSSRAASIYHKINNATAGDWAQMAVAYLQTDERDHSGGSFFRGSTGTVASLDAWAQVADLGGIGQVSSVVALPAWSEGGPRQWLLIPDPNYRGADNVYSVTDQGGRYAGSVIAGDDNVGIAMGILEGTPTADTDWELICQHAGSLDGVAGILHRLDGETPWLGLNSPIHLGEPVSFWSADPAVGHTIAYSSRYNRVLVLRAEPSATNGSGVPLTPAELQIRYRDADENTRTWTSLTEEVDLLVEGGEIAVCELHTGDMLAAVEKYFNASISKDAALIRSSDGGLSWSIIVESMLSASQVDSTVGDFLLQTKLESAGPWVRYTAIDDTTGQSGQIRTYVSPDGGVSWSMLDSHLTLTFHIDRDSGGGIIDDSECSYDMIGIAETTQFLMVMPVWVDESTTRDSAANLRLYYASRDLDWENSILLPIDDLFIGTASAVMTVQSLCLARIMDHVIIMVWGQNTSASPNQFGCWAAACPIGRVEDVSAWFRVGRVAQYRGEPEVWPYRPKAVWCGNHLALTMGLTVQADSTIANGDVTLHAGGWSERPWYPEAQDRLAKHPIRQLGSLTYIDLLPHQGAPWWASASITAWSDTTLGSGAVTWSSDYIEIDAPDTTADVAKISHQSVPASTERWGFTQFNPGHGTAFLFEAQVVDCSSGNTGGEFVLARLKGDVSPNLDRWDLSLQIRATNQLVVYENFVGTDLLTVNVDLTEWREYRLHVILEYPNALKNSPQTRIVTLASRLVSGDTKSDWVEHGVVTAAASGGAHTSQWIIIGCETTNPSSTGRNRLRIRHVRVSQDTGASQGRADWLWTSPNDFLGAPTSRYPLRLRGDLHVRWGGVGMAVGDTFTGHVLHTAGKSNLSVDSPRIGTESTTTGAWNIVLSAKPNPGATPTGVRKMHAQALALLNTVDRTATIEWGDDPDDWSTPALRVEANADVLTDLRVVAVSGNSVQLERFDGEVLPPRGSLIGHYLRFTSATSAKDYTYRISLDADEDGWFLLDTDDVDLATAGVAAGISAVVFGDRMIVRLDQPYRYPYLRVSFPASAHTSATVLAGRHRIGAIVPGFPYDLNPTIEWTPRESDTPYHQAYGSEAGHTQVYVRANEAPRVIDGRIVGNVTDETRDQRKLVATLMREVTRYGARPVVLVVNGDDLAQGYQAISPRDCAIYGRWSSVSRDHASWAKDADGRWFQTGDSDFSFTEVV